MVFLFCFPEAPVFVSCSAFFFCFSANEKRCFFAALPGGRLDRCRFAGKQNFEQCFYYGSDVSEQADAAAPVEPALEKSRRAPPTW